MKVKFLKHFLLEKYIITLLTFSNFFKLFKKHKLPAQTKTLLFVAGIFLVVIFLFPCEILVICLFPTYRVIV